MSNIECGCIFVSSFRAHSEAVQPEKAQQETPLQIQQVSSTSLPDLKCRICGSCSSPKDGWGQVLLLTFKTACPDNLSGLLHAVLARF